MENERILLEAQNIKNIFRSAKVLYTPSMASASNCARAKRWVWSANPAAARRHSAAFCSASTM